jgi:3'(2'), 5'-bisphosphate nucleotidase
MMRPEATNDRLQTLIILSNVAGRAILKVYEGEDWELRFKSSESPVTRADMIAHDLILSGLHTLDPRVPVLSEESAMVPYQERQQWDTYWLVDPLDGTKEFLKRNGEFTVNIALIVHGIPALGVVHAPTTNMTYFAAQGEGAFKQKADESPVKIQVSNDAAEKLKIVASRSHSGGELEKYLGKLKDYEVLSAGSSLKFCLVAEGTAHLYPRLAPTMEWDTAAGQCIVEAAGGSVTDLSGQRLRYNKPKLTNPSFLASSAGSQWLGYFADVNQTT